MSIGRSGRASNWVLSLSRVIVPLCEKNLVAKENMSEKTHRLSRCARDFDLSQLDV
jgi:hypothetical protein